MAGDIKLSDVILKSFVEGKIDELDQTCTAGNEACEGITITQDQEDVIAFVLHDGKITDREKLMLGFLPQSVVNSVAGEDNLKPARMRAEALVKKLAAAEPGEISLITSELMRLDPATRAIALPEVKKILAKIDGEKTKAEADYKKNKAAYDRSYAQKTSQIEALEERIQLAEQKYHEIKRDGYRRINNMEISTDGVVYQNKIAAHESKMANHYSTTIQPLRNQKERLEEQRNKLVEPQNLAGYYGKDVIELKGYIDGSMKVFAPGAPASILPLMTVEELEAQFHEYDNDNAFLTMIDRFPQDGKTVELSHQMMRSVSSEIQGYSRMYEDHRRSEISDVRERAAERYDKAMERTLTYPTVVKALEHVGRFRARLEPVIDDVPEELLPQLFASNPKENVSDLVIPRIMSAEKDTEWKLSALAAVSEKADHVTFDRIVAAVKPLSHWDREKFSRMSERYRRKVGVESTIRESVESDVSRARGEVQRARDVAYETASESRFSTASHKDSMRGNVYIGGSYHDIAERNGAAVESNKGYGASLNYNQVVAPLHLLDETLSLGIGGGLLLSRAASDYEPRKNASSSGFTDVAGLHATGLLGLNLSRSLMLDINPRFGYYHVSHGYRGIEEGGEETNGRSMSEGKFGWGSDVALKVMLSEDVNRWDEDMSTRVGLSLTYGLTRFGDIAADGADNNGDGDVHVVGIGLSFANDY